MQMAKKIPTLINKAKPLRTCVHAFPKTSQPNVLTMESNSVQTQPSQLAEDHPARYSVESKRLPKVVLFQPSMVRLYIHCAYFRGSSHAFGGSTGLSVLVHHPEMLGARRQHVASRKKRNIAHTNSKPNHRGQNLHMLQLFCAPK